MVQQHALLIMMTQIAWPSNKGCWSRIQRTSKTIVFRVRWQQNAHFRSFRYVLMVIRWIRNFRLYSHQLFKELGFHCSQWSRSCLCGCRESANAVMANASQGDRRAVWEALAMGEELLVRATNTASFNWQARIGWSGYSNPWLLVGVTTAG